MFICIIGSKRVVFEEGSRGPPPELFLTVFIQNGAILCKTDGYMYWDIMKQQDRKLF